MSSILKHAFVFLQGSSQIPVARNANGKNYRKPSNSKITGEHTQTNIMQWTSSFDLKAAMFVF